VAEQLNEDALNNRYAHLVLVADPTTLGASARCCTRRSRRLLGDIART
jgi:protein required for attachment to host cells